MIAAPSLAYHQEISADDQRLRPQGAGADSQLIDSTRLSAVSHLKSTPNQLYSQETIAVVVVVVVVDDDYEYRTPPAQKVTTLKVRFRHIGKGKPMPMDDAELDGR